MAMGAATELMFIILPPPFSRMTGSTARLALVNAFLDEARATGLVKAAIDRAGLRGADPAPKME